MASQREQSGGRGRQSKELIGRLARDLAAGRSVDDVAYDLTREGWKEDEARTFVGLIDRARKAGPPGQTEPKQLRRGFLMHIVMGALWIVAGVTLMITASPQRDLSSLGVAVITFGVIEGVWAIRNWRRG